jgi:hypothetical protein
MKKNLILIAIILLMAACADVSPCATECVSVNSYGFWSGLWHGMIIPFSWIGSLFSDNIAIYGVNNNGGWYDFGFVLGCGALFSSSKTKSK